MGQPMPALAANDAEPKGPRGNDADIPLAVDLDGTLDLREHHNALGQVTRTERLAVP